MALREGTAADLPGVLRVRVASKHLARTAYELKQRGFTVESAAALLATDWKLWVDEEDGEIVGFCLADRARESILAWFVLKRASGKGRGPLLFACAVKWLWENGAQQIWLETDRSAPVADWYKKNSWREIGEGPSGYVRFELERPQTLAAPVRCGRCQCLGYQGLAGAFVVNLIVSGCLFGFPLTFEMMAESLGAAPDTLAIAFSTALLLYFALGVVSGWLCTRFNPRNIMLIGTVAAGVGMLIAAAAPNIWCVVFGFGLGVGVGGAFTYLPSIAPLRRWFDRQYAFAVGTASAGIAVGLAAVPLLALLLHSSGWRSFYLVLGLLCLIAATLAAFLVKGPPQWYGCLSDGRCAAAVEQPPPGWDRNVLQSLAAALADPRGAVATAVSHGRVMTSELFAMLGWAWGTRKFKLILAAGFLAALGFQLPILFLVPFAMQNGLDFVTAGWLYAGVGLAGCFGRIVLGGAADRRSRAGRHGTRGLLAATALGISVSLLWWAWISCSGGGPFVELLAFAVLFGFVYGGVVPLFQVLIQKHFEQSFAFLGAALISVGLGSFVGVTLKAYVLSGGYTTAIVGGVIATAVSAILIRCVR